MIDFCALIITGVKMERVSRTFNYVLFGVDKIEGVYLYSNIKWGDT